MNRTIWWCERCHASGLEALDGLDVYSGVHRLEQAHDLHALAIVADCVFSTVCVRVSETTSGDDGTADKRGKTARGQPVVSTRVKEKD